MTAPCVIVIGGTGTLGRELVRELGRRGARVGFTFHQAADVARALVDAVPGSVSRALDLRRIDTIGPALSGLADELGGVDALVHAAGVASLADPARFDRLDDLEDAAWDRLFAVNVKGAAFAIRALAPSLGERAGASGANVVLVGALAGRKIVPGPAAYAASKAALIGLAQALAKELGPRGVRVNVLAPGLFDGGGGMTALPDDLRAEYKKHVALKRLARPAEIVRVASWLALDNTYVTGQVLAVDGGL